MKDKLKFNINFKPRTVLFLVTILCIGMIGVTYFRKDTASSLKEVVGYVIVPMQKGLNQIGTALSEFTLERKQLNEVIAENDALNDKISALEDRLALYQDSTYELQRLRNLLELKESYQDYEMVGANIVAKEAGNWYHKFTIDKGSNDGLAVNMNVLVDGGLAGIITDVGKNFSTVTTIIDDKSYVSGMTKETLDTCWVSGDLSLMNNGYIRIENIDKDAAIEDMTPIVTSSISDKYHKGILIGYATDIELDSNKLTKSGYLIPAVDFQHMSEVLVITTLKETSD